MSIQGGFGSSWWGKGRAWGASIATQKRAMATKTGGGQHIKHQGWSLTECYGHNIVCATTASLCEYGIWMCLLQRGLNTNPNRLIHCKKCQNWKQMVLHDVMNDAIVVNVPKFNHSAHQTSLHTEPTNEWWGPPPGATSWLSGST